MCIRDSQVHRVERDFPHLARQREKAAEYPAIERRMRLPAQVHHFAAKYIGGVLGMQRLHLRVDGFGEINVVVALDGLVEKRNADGQDYGQRKQQTLYWGFHRSTGLRAAVTSSTRLVRVP